MKLKLTQAVLAICTLTLVACGGGASEPEPRPTKQEIAERLADGRADAMVDWCAKFGWYDDGICDEFCLLPDGDCDGGAYEPCGGLSCGEECSLCAPGDADCFETAVIKVCQPDGSCGASVPTCDDGDDDDGDDGDDSNDDWTPCGGLACGDSCTICAPGDADCYETAELKFCQPDGTCMGVEPQSCDPDGEYDPCDGKACGDTCTLCDPDDADCVETLSIKACNDEGVCSDTLPVCQ